MSVDWSCRWVSGSQSWHYLHSFTIPPLVLSKMRSYLLLLSFYNCPFFIARSRSMITASYGWKSILLCSCNISHYCFNTVDGLDYSILVFSGQCILNIEVPLLFFPSIVATVRRPSPNWSTPLVMMTEKIFVVQWWRSLQICSYCSKWVINPRCAIIFFVWTCLFQ